MKKIFIHEAYITVLFGSKSECITADLFVVLYNYGLYDFVLSYLAGGSFLINRLWKSIVVERVYIVETEQWKQGLVMKGAHRFGRILPDLKPSYIYDIMKNNLIHRKPLMLLVKQISLPENLVITCNLCTKFTPYIPYHILMECTYLIVIRTYMWETLLDDLGVEAEVNLFQREGDDILDIFLGKKWGSLINEDKKVKFSMTIAKYN